MAALVGAVAMIGVPALADQTEPRLDPLFERLQDTRDAAEAEAIEQAIWSLWTRTDDPLLDLDVIAGIQAMNRGNLPQALESFDRVTEQAPDYAEGWNKRATVLYLLSDYDRSLADIARTLKLEPRHFGALSGMGMIYLQLGDKEAALKAMEEALALNPHMPGLRVHVEELRRLEAGDAI